MIFHVSLGKVMWRFLPAGDDFVDYFASRDTDSMFTRRERDSVDAWLSEGTLLHAMRDHVEHNYPIMGGATSKVVV